MSATDPGAPGGWVDYFHFPDRDEVIEVLLREKTPFVVIGRSAGAPVLSVNNDNVEASRRATNHLLEQGYRKIAFISCPRNLVVSLDRCHGYEKALAEAGLPVESERIVETDFSEDAGFAALYRMREAGVEFDAVLASDDLFALGALRFANHTGLRVPEELGIVGFNDTPMMSHTHPPLTSVRILSYELGAEAMELLLQGLKNPEKLRPGKEILLPAELRVRRSSLRRQGRDGSKKVGKGEKEMSKEKLLRRFRKWASMSDPWKTCRRCSGGNPSLRGSGRRRKSWLIWFSGTGIFSTNGWSNFSRVKRCPHPGKWRT